MGCAASQSDAIVKMTTWVANLKTEPAKPARLMKVPKNQQPLPLAASLIEKRNQIRQIIQRMFSIEINTPGWAYLRHTRGLIDAPISLIENNASIFYVPHSVAELAVPDAEITHVQLPAIAFVTELYSALQQIYIDPETNQKAFKAKVIKKTYGHVIIGEDRSDTVLIQRCELTATAFQFIAEGPETALSVALAFGRLATVRCALGIGNIEKVHTSASTAIWCREKEHAGSGVTTETLERVRCGLRRHHEHVVEIYPPDDDGDFNDTHKRLPGICGSERIIECVREQFIRHGRRDIIQALNI